MRRPQTIISALVVATIAAIGYRLLHPPPPNLVSDGYVSATFDFREYDEALPALKTSTSDPAVVQALAQVLAAGKNDVNCRCIDLATVTLARPDGTQFVFRIMPAHSDGDCQVAVGANRYAVDRNGFLKAVASLEVPAPRWIGP